MSAARPAPPSRDTEREARQGLLLLVAVVCLVFSPLAALAALAERRLASRVEQARGFNIWLVLCPQSAAGMGLEEEAKRIRGAVGVTILHQVNDAELIAHGAAPAWASSTPTATSRGSRRGRAPRAATPIRHRPQ